MVVEGDGPVVEIGVRIVGGVGPGHHRVATEILVRDTERSHVALVPECVDLRWGHQSEGHIPATSEHAASSPAASTTGRRRPLLPLVAEAAVHEHRVGGAGSNRGGGLLDGG